MKLKKKNNKERLVYCSNYGGAAVVSRGETKGPSAARWRVGRTHVNTVLHHDRGGGGVF